MRYFSSLAALLAGLGLVLATPTAARAGSDDVETGFKREIGAIGARTVIGIGIGLFNGVTESGVGYDGQYAYPVAGYAQGGRRYKARQNRHDSYEYEQPRYKRHGRHGSAYCASGHCGHRTHQYRRSGHHGRSHYARRAYCGTHHAYHGAHHRARHHETRHRY